MNPNVPSSFIRFCVVGVANTAIDFAVFLVLYYGAGFWLLAAHGAGFAVATANSYVLNKRWTFGDPGPDSGDRIMKFLILTGTALVLNSVVLMLCAAFMHVVAAKICATVFSLVWNYAGMRLVVFTGRRGGKHRNG